MTKVGIDAISFYTAHHYLDLAALATERNIDVNKFYQGLGQHLMSVPSPSEDIVTMAANAGKQLLQNEDTSSIDTMFFATESGIDQSKAAGTYVHRLLDLPETCRVVELKQACYSGTFSLQMACAWTAQHPEQKVLIIMSDNARYGLKTPGESSQGCAAVAMLISVNPRVLAIEAEYGIHTDEIMDFWRPNYRDEALVDGHYSTKMYLHALEKTWSQYSKKSGRHFADHHCHLYHVPIPRFVEKAHKHLAAYCEFNYLSEEQEKNSIQDCLVYNREIGNCYSAALYLSLISLLDHRPDNLAGKRLGFYSYGSGSVAEYFSGIVQEGYQSVVDKNLHENMLASRKLLTYQQYEEFYKFTYPSNGGRLLPAPHASGSFRLAGIDRHQRIYEKV